MAEPTREPITVTPPLLDTPAMRDWLELEAYRCGWTDLAWTEEIDNHGKPMGRLTGVKRG